jgi:hypothetical protein
MPGFWLVVWGGLGLCLELESVFMWLLHTRKAGGGYGSCLEVGENEKHDGCTSNNELLVRPAAILAEARRLVVWTRCVVGA